MVGFPGEYLAKVRSGLANFEEERQEGYGFTAGFGVRLHAPADSALDRPNIGRVSKIRVEASECRSREAESNH